MVESYLKLKDPATSQNLESKFPQFIELHSGEPLRKEDRRKFLSLQRLDDMRLYSSDMKMDMAEQSGSITYIYIIGLIGLLILLLACINFMNLTTARSSQRSGEIGIRKSMGAYRGNLVRQFLGKRKNLCRRRITMVAERPRRVPVCDYYFSDLFHFDHTRAEDAPGMSVFFEPAGEPYEFTVIGVVKDFHQFSLHQEISPMIFLLPVCRTNFNYLVASIDVTAYRNLYSRMKTIWDERISDIPFEMVFLSENVKKLYSDEVRTSTMLTISTTIALIISCLGLYALSVYIAERKTKEIGIRKVFGAPVKSITGMLSREYIILIVISLLISVPLGYYAMSKWLEGFAYKIKPGVIVFVISGLVSVLIAWLTISFESIRAANRNPAETLRNS